MDTGTGAWGEGVAAAAALVAREAARARAVEASLAVRARAAAGRAARASAEEREETARLAASWQARLPLVGRRLAAAQVARVGAAAASRASAEAERREVAASGRRVRQERARLEAVVPRLEAAGEAGRRLGPVPPWLSTRAETEGNRASFLRSRPRATRAEVIASAEAIAAVAREWAAEAKRRAERQAGPAPVPAAAPVRTGAAPAGTPRVYLPVPVTMRDAAAALGARYDPEGGFGSRMYVTADLVGKDPRLDGFLPLLYRSSRRPFRFDPIRRAASGQNLWSVFDAATWARVKTSLQAANGRRCVLCGRRSGDGTGTLSRLVDRNSRGTVDCHEMWSWSVSRRNPDVGVQRLDGILNVCRECHGAFHRDQVVRDAAGMGLAAEADNALERRQMEIAGLSHADLVAANEASARAAAAQAGTRTWIMDLSHLARQDYLAHAEPVLRGENRAGVGAGLIAGIAFRDAAGTRHPAVPVPVAAARLEGYAPPPAEADDLLRRLGAG